MNQKRENKKERRERKEKRRELKIVRTNKKGCLCCASSFWFQLKYFNSLKGKKEKKEREESKRRGEEGQFDFAFLEKRGKEKERESREKSRGERR